MAKQLAAARASRLVQVAALLAGLSAAACGFDISPPPSFAEVRDEAEFDFRAASASGVVMGVDRRRNEPRGNLDFWADAVDGKLRQNGYRAVGGRAVNSKDGVPGKELHYEVTRDGRTQEFWVAVFVTKRRVYLVQAGGDQERFRPARQQVARAIESFDL